MLNFITKIDAVTGQEIIETSLRGKDLMSAALLNKGTAFTQEERMTLGLLGKLPCHIETLEEQLARVRHQYKCYKTVLQKHIYLNNLHDKNEVLFFRLLTEDLIDILPLIYTPGVGRAVQQFSSEFRQPRGLYINYPDRESMELVINNRTHPDIELLVVTDGEGVLGIGDQGIGGIDIPIAKLILYSLCGINPYKTLPVMLDVGTDNPKLLADPLYLGWRHPRIRGKEYDDFIKRFIDIVHRELPHMLLHWEDFGRDNGRKILNTYQNTHCMFNDDMQGTGVVAQAALLSAIRATNIPLEQHQIVIFGAGTAGTGIADELYRAMLRKGIAPEHARKQFWLIDKNGLVMVDSPGIMDFQRMYAKSPEDIKHFSNKNILDLAAVVSAVKPSILLGTSAVNNAFTESIVRNMAQYCQMPIIFPLSNPTDKAEATPRDVVQWTEGRALIASGTPFGPVDYQGKSIPIAQCNNALCFPGLGIGVLATRASYISNDMLWRAAQAISDFLFEDKNKTGQLLPSIYDAPQVALQVAYAVADQAFKDGVARVSEKSSPVDLVNAIIWKPFYRMIQAK